MYGDLQRVSGPCAAALATLAVLRQPETFERLDFLGRGWPTDSGRSAVVWDLTFVVNEGPTPTCGSRTGT